MLRIAIVEDDHEQSERMKQHLADYFADKEDFYTIDVYPNGLEFIDRYRNPYDIVLMDIEMPMMNGLETARKLRQIDEVVVLIFVTKMSQFALNGYEVAAAGYIVKPVNRYSMHMNMQRAMKLLPGNRNKKIVLQTKGSVVSFSTRELMYIEVYGHKLNYHLQNDVHEAYGNLSDMENELHGFDFSRCSNAYLVNLAFVKAIAGNETILADGERLSVSRGMKKSFMDDYVAYLGR